MENKIFENSALNVSEIPKDKGDFADLNLDLETETEEGKIVTNLELGITFRETVINLPISKQEELGIKRIRRKKLIEFPESMKLEPMMHGIGEVGGYSLKEEHWPIYDYLTNGRFTSFETLNHRMFADTREEKRAALLENFKKEGQYFQKYDTSRYLDVMHSPYAWGSTNLDVPLFSFGIKNGQFVKYLEAILGNQEVIQELKKAFWSDEKIDIYENSNSQGYLYAAGFIIGTNFEFDENKLSENRVEKRRLLLEKEVNVYASPRNKNLELFRMILGGKPVYSNIGHPTIPTINHPDVPELRWCHSEFAIIPTRNSLNVLFFETD